MTWRSDDLLWLLLLIPVVAALPLAAWWLRRRATRRFGQDGVLGPLVAGRSGPWRATRGLLITVTFALLTLALAGPQVGSRTRILRQRGLDIVVALDFSKSMLARDVRPSRIERAKAELGRLIEELEGDRVGIVAFAGETMEFPMTSDYAALQLFFRDLGPYDMPVGGTAIARALIASKRLLDRASGGGPEGAERDRVVILMTDGEDHEGDPEAAAEELAEAGIRVYTVGIGSRTGEPIPTYAPDGTWIGYLRDEEDQVVTTALTQDNERILGAVAESTGGRYFRAGRGQVGVDAVREELAALHRDERETRRVTVQEPRYALVLLPAFLLLVLEALLPEAWIGRRRRVPPPPKARRRGRELAT